jgi:myo-inositol-1(or 4)-monophosphatase
MEEFSRVALAAVEEAGLRLSAAWKTSKRIERKGAIDLVTETDRELEAMIVERLRRAFPDHRIVAEEASSGASVTRPDDAEHVWYLDPLDGTTNFAHSLPQFAISLGLARGRELLFGAVLDPIRAELFVARRGGGATLNGQPIAVSRVASLADALLGTGFPYDSRERADEYLRFFKAAMLHAQGVRRMGAAALDLCAVACGRFDGFWEWGLKPWDTAAGALIVHEAGGIVTDLAGDAFDPHGEQTLASNGAIHAELVEVMKRTIADG